MDQSAESDTASEVDEQTKAWESDTRSLTRRINDDATTSNADCGIGHRVQARRSVLALVLDDECVFAGLQGGDIAVRILLQMRYYYLLTDQAWSLDNFSLVLSIRAHKESVLGLYLSEDNNLLFSSGGDSVVNVSLPYPGWWFGQI